MTEVGAARVDYEVVAANYESGRVLDTKAMSRWRDAVLPHLPLRDRPVVIDVGAGTGIFARSWPRWLACSVIAVEPSGAMRAEACGLPSHRDVRWLAASAEALGLADQCADIVWMSTVVHHFRDPDAVVREAWRVLRPGGVVLIRSFFPDHSQVGWLPYFPLNAAVPTRFPSTTDVINWFTHTGFTSVSVDSVDERKDGTVEDVLRWVQQMRDADSILTCFTDSEFAAGVSALTSAPPDTRLHNQLTLIALTKALAV